MKKSILVPIISAALALFIGFFGGMTYQKSKIPSFANGTMRQTNGQFTQRTGNGTTQKNGFMNRGNAVSGKIISLDSTSITVQTNDGSNKIVMLSDSTKVNKTSEAVKTDLKQGDTVMIIGTTDSTSGTITAQTINIGGVLQAPTQPNASTPSPTK